MIKIDDTEDKLWTTSPSPSSSDLLYGDETEEDRKKRHDEYNEKKLLED